MTQVEQGATITLLSEWFEFAGGPATDLVSTPTINIVRASDNDNTVPQTTGGVLHPATGVYSYNWAVPAFLQLGNYVAIWRGISAIDLSPVQATEVIEVVGSTTPGATWATPAEASSITGETITQAQLNVAYHVIETRAGVVTAARDNLTNRDHRLLKKAESYQAAWMAGQIALMTRSDADLVSQDGLQYSKGDQDMHILAPLAKSNLLKLSWMRTRTMNPLTPSQALALRNKVYQETYGLYDYDDEEFLGAGGKWVPM